MADFPPVRYWLPKTVFTVTVTCRDEVLYDEIEGDDGKPPTQKSYLQKAADLTIAPKIVPDRTASATTEVHAGFLESVSCEVKLDDNGVIESIGTNSGRDISPVINLAAKLVQFASPVKAGLAVAEDSELQEELDKPKKYLEDLWSAAFEDQHALINDLTERMKSLLTGLAHADTEKIPDIGNALQVVERELGALDRMRRDWIMSRAVTDAPETWTFTTKDLMAQGLRFDLPNTLLHDTKFSEAQQKLVDKAGILLVLGGPIGTQPDTDLDRKDVLVLRRPRSMTLGVYTREKDGQEWKHDPSRDTVLDVLDQNSRLDEISFDGKWTRTNGIKLDFHPDGSIKTYSVSSTPALAEVATAVGGALDAVATARKEQKPADAEAEALAKAKTKLDLLKTSNEYAQLAATHGSAAELAELEQRVKLAELRQKV